jgi:hypothetical protein
MFQICSNKPSLKVLPMKLPVFEAALVDTQNEDLFTVAQDPFSRLQTGIVAQCSCIVSLSAHKYATGHSEFKNLVPGITHG